MNEQTTSLRTRLATLRQDPRVAAFSLLGPGGQVFGLVDELIAELGRLDESVHAAHIALAKADWRIRELELQLQGLGALTVNKRG